MDDLGKRVGWYPRPVEWPHNLREIEVADPEQLLEWYRFLPCAENESQRAMVLEIVRKLEEVNHGS